jgi:hypothetical protein
MGAFEDFVNIELPLRISTQENGGGSGNLPPDRILLTTGIGLGVRSAPTPDSGIIYLDTDQDISGNRAIAVDTYARYASSDEPLLTAVGISVRTVSAGDPLPVQISGKMLVSMQGWTPSLAVFVGIKGVLTQVPASSGYTQKVGIAIDSENLMIEIAQPIYLD